MLLISSAVAQSAAVRVIPRAGWRALMFVLMAALVALCAAVATPAAHASGTYMMKPDCYNSGTWGGLIKPWAKASRQSPDFGCFETPLQVLEAQCTFLVTNGNASDCALFSPPPPVTENTPPGKGYNLAHGGTQGTTYWDVLVNFFGLCTPPAVQTEGLTCSCPPNTAQSQARDRCVPISVVPEAQAEPCDCAGGPGRGNPIYPLRGVKRERVDLGITIGGLPLALTYDSSSLVPRVPAALDDFGSAPIMQPLLGRPEWSASFVRRLIPEVLSRHGEPVTINAVRGDGTVTSFSGANGQYAAGAGGVQRLTKLPSGDYRFEDPRANSREFYSSGLLQRIEWADGRRVSFGYSDATTPASIAPGAGYLITLTDQLGLQVRIAYGYEVASPYDPAPDLPTRITTADGQVLRIQYNNQRSVSEIKWPDGKGRSFLYENDSFPWALTTIVDERAVRYATFGYDSTGLAISSTHVGGVDSTTVHYGTPPAIQLFDVPLDDDGSMRVMQWQPPQDVVITGPNGTTESWTSTSLNGHNFLSSRTQAAGAGSAAGASGQSFDAKGNLASSDDMDGRRTCYVSDAGSGLQTVRVEGLTQQACDSVTAANAALPAGARKTTLQWHADWSLEQRRAEPRQITTSVYNGQPDPFNGNATASCAPSNAQLLDGRSIAVLCKQVEQATTDADGHLGFGAGLQAGVAARITTWTYNALGQVLTTQGPRPQDATSYAYHTETNDDHRTGDLSSITDAKGKVTHFDRYDQLGQLLQSTDPNGVVTVITYDARQRLLSRTVGTETTSYTYDAIGQLTRVTQPDGTWVGFEYDDAHRRIAAKDSDGNRIDYALDNAGNRVGETVRDPAGILARNSARLLDALGRVQQETTPAAYQAPAGEAAWTTVASEGESFSATGTWTVRYGATGRWLTRTVTGTVPCTFDYFGGDPAPGTAKSCQRLMRGADCRRTRLRW
jgi:YD repeat-containing protein